MEWFVIDPRAGCWLMLNQLRHASDANTKLNAGNMWLIDTRTLELKFFAGPPDRYAILSHTWRDNQEVSFQEFHRIEVGDESNSRVRNKSGYKKDPGILQACQGRGSPVRVGRHMLYR
jgi:hypothetical protein